MIVAIVIEYFTRAWVLQRQAALGPALDLEADCWPVEPLRLLACPPHRRHTWLDSPPVKRCTVSHNAIYIKKRIYAQRTCSQMAVLLPSPSLASF
jgi:hypothetical protein